MCFAKTPKVEQYKASAQAQEPDDTSIATAASRRATDRIRAGTNTVLTGAQGVLQNAATQKPTLLGGTA